MHCTCHSAYSILTIKLHSTLVFILCHTVQQPAQLLHSLPTHNTLLQQVYSISKTYTFEFVHCMYDSM